MKTLTTEQKSGVVQAVMEYRTQNGLSQGEMAKRAGVGEAYISTLENGKTHVGKSEIGDHHYRKLAEAVGYHLEPVYWVHCDTKQYRQMYAELLGAKVSGKVRVLIGNTRHGKTYSTHRFVQAYPAETYLITVSSLYRLNDIINELCEVLGVDKAGSYVSRLNRIAKKLDSKMAAGGKPQIVIDEAENMTVPVLRMCKALYDAVKDKCSLTFVGTRQFTHKVEQLKDKNVDGMPQFYARMKAGIREIDEIDKERDFAPFLALAPTDGVREIVMNWADNYGELNDYLEYALREADRMGVELTEKFLMQLFRA